MLRFTRTMRLLGLVLALPSAAAAQGLANYDYENLSLRGLGVDVGRIWPDKVDATWLYSARFDLGYLGPAVRIVPGLSYWSSKLRRRELERFAAQLEKLPPLQEQDVSVEPDDLGRIDWSGVSLSADAHLVWTAPLRILTYVGLGLGIHSMSGRGAAIDGTFIEDLLDTTTAGMAAMGGLEYEPARWLRLYGEARYTLVSDIRYPGVRAGAALMFPPPPTASGRMP
jgi:opacity protein-like surface antigen